MVRPLLFFLILGAALWALFRMLFAEGKRRVQRHELAMQAKEREKEATTEYGGAPDNPILVATPSVVEAEATGRRCVRCGAEMRLEEHAAETFEAERLRVARLRCPQCGAERSLYFRIGQLS